MASFLIAKKLFQPAIIEPGMEMPMFNKLTCKVIIFIFCLPFWSECMYSLSYLHVLLKEFDASFLTMS